MWASSEEPSGPSNEFIAREIFRPAPAEGQAGLSSLDEWKAHESAIPALTLGGLSVDLVDESLLK